MVAMDINNATLVTRGTRTSVSARSAQNQFGAVSGYKGSNRRLRNEHDLSVCMYKKLYPAVGPMIMFMCINLLMIVLQCHQCTLTVVIELSLPALTYSLLRVVSLTCPSSLH